MHEKMETDPVCNSGGFAVVRKYAVWAAETVDPDEQAGDIQELKEKLEGLIPEEELGKYTKKEPIGEHV